MEFEPLDFDHHPSFFPLTSPACPLPDITCSVASILSLSADTYHHLLTLPETRPSSLNTVSAPAAPLSRGHFPSHSPPPRRSRNERTWLLASMSFADYALPLLLKPLSRALGPAVFLPMVTRSSGCSTHDPFMLVITNPQATSLIPWFQPLTPCHSLQWCPGVYGYFNIHRGQLWSIVPWPLSFLVSSPPMTWSSAKHTISVAVFKNWPLWPLCNSNILFSQSPPCVSLLTPSRIPISAIPCP